MSTLPSRGEDPVGADETPGAAVLGGVLHHQEVATFPAVGPEDRGREPGRVRGVARLAGPLAQLAPHGDDRIAHRCEQVRLVGDVAQPFEGALEGVGTLGQGRRDPLHLLDRHPSVDHRQGLGDDGPGHQLAVVGQVVPDVGQLAGRRAGSGRRRAPPGPPGTSPTPAGRAPGELLGRATELDLGLGGVAGPGHAQAPLGGNPTAVHRVGHIGHVDHQRHHPQRDQDHDGTDRESGARREADRGRPLEGSPERVAAERTHEQRADRGGEPHGHDTPTREHREHHQETLREHEQDDGLEG